MEIGNRRKKLAELEHTYAHPLVISREPLLPKTIWGRPGKHHKMCGLQEIPPPQIKKSQSPHRLSHP